MSRADENTKDIKDQENIMNNRTYIGYEDAKLRIIKGSDYVDEIIKYAFRMIETGYIDINRITSFKEYPFAPCSQNQIMQLAENITLYGQTEPIIVRRILDPEFDFEMIDGHKRAEALKKSGINVIEAYIIECSDDEAAVILCENNLNKGKKLKISEKAQAYRIEMEALKHRSRHLKQNRADERKNINNRNESGRLSNHSEFQGNNELGSHSELKENTTRAILAKRHDISAANLSRMIRLTNLTDSLQAAVDKRKIPFNVGVALSHLNHTEQEDINDMLGENVHITLEIAEKIKKQRQKRMEPFKKGELRSIIMSEATQIDSSNTDPDAAKLANIMDALSEIAEQAALQLYDAAGDLDLTLNVAQRERITASLVNDIKENCLTKADSDSLIKRGLVTKAESDSDNGASSIK